MKEIMALNYEITPLINQHIYRVKLTFSPSHTTYLLKMPTWIPGSYMIREFSKQLNSIKAYQKTLLKIAQLTKNSWQICDIAPGEIITIEYDIYAAEIGIRTAYLDFNRGYFNPTSLCLSVVDCENLPHLIEVKSLPDNWAIATSLVKTAHHSYLAVNYAELIDSPFELGDFIKFEFEIDGVLHYLILSGTIVPFNEARLIADIGKICQYQIKLFANQIPYGNYTFILNLTGEVYTGLEHHASTLLMAPFYALPNLQGSNDDDYHKLLGLISHEFFHTWNVKQIKPQAFMPYNLDTENYTSLLWWFEGVTSYYDDLVLYRTGIIDQSKYLNIIVENLNSVYKYNGVNVQSLAESSFNAWTKYYRQDENSPNSVVSYYVKGALVTMCLDLLIRQNSNYSLDDVMRHMYKLYLENNSGIAENSIARLIFDATGVNLADFINLASQTTHMLPFDQIMSKVGLELIKRTADSYQDNGK